MDERQTQIREGAGLEESRLNREFIDWLSRWSTPILLVILAIAAGYIVYQRVQQSRLETVNQAFLELGLASSTASPNPRALEDIARTYRNVRGVPHIANLAAADEYLRSVRLGVAPGAQVSPDGAVAEGDVLTDEQRTRYLSEAERLYGDVLGKTEPEPAKAIHAISAAYGLAAISEIRGDFEAARRHYERVIAIAERTGFESQAAVARQRIANMGALAERPRLYAAAELPKLPGSESQPATPELPGLNDAGGVFQPPQFFDLQPEQALPGTMDVPGGTPDPDPENPQDPPAEEPADPASPK